MSERLKSVSVEDILKLDVDLFPERTLFSFVNETLLELENQRFKKGNTAEHKLLFLIGDQDRDVAKARIAGTGKGVYTDPPNYPKAPEILEASAAISAHFEVGENISRVVSEIVDVFYNLSHLTVLDSEFEGAYNGCIERLSSALGLSIREMLFLTIAKYGYRWIDKKGKKSTKEEDERIKLVLNSGKVRMPSKKNLVNVYGEMFNMETHVFRSRLDQLRFMTDGKESRRGCSRWFRLNLLRAHRNFSRR